MKNAFRRLVATLLEGQTRRLLKRHNFKIVAVSGSLGKTSTKLAIAQVLSQKYKVLVQHGSFNDEIGLPLAVFNLEVPDNIFNVMSWVKLLAGMERALWRPYPYEVLVAEVGTDAPGEIPRFMKYLHPDIGVVTAVAAEHMEYFKTLEVVAAEELALVGGSKVALVGVDDVAPEYLKRFGGQHERLHGYGLGQGLEYSLDVLTVDLRRGALVDVYRKRAMTMQDIELSLYARHSVKAAAAAYAAGCLMGLSEGELFDGLEALRPMHGRMNPLPGVNGSLVIDDTYNSSPDAVIAALSTLRHAGGGGRRIAVLGSMNELGEASADYHREVGAAAAGLDLLLTVGDAAGRWLGPAAVAAGMEPARLHGFASPYAAGEWLRSRLEPNDIVLAKGSQNGVFTEETVKLLLARSEDAAQLVRQSPAWLARKRRQFADAPTKS